MDAPALIAAPRRKGTSSFNAWLEAKPYWERYLWHCHLVKEIVGQDDLDNCYRYLLEDAGVAKTRSARPIVTFPLITLDGAELSAAKTSLDKIDGLRNVNAIDEGCVIEFSKHLTIIYGDNGAGKSGIGRLLSNACHSRKPRKLLPNARKTRSSSSRACADFHIRDAARSHVIKYTFGETHLPLKAFTVFDHECSLIHLNNENKVEFVPSKLQVFDDVFRSITHLEEKLQDEFIARELEDPTEDLFELTSPITDFLDQISHETTDKEVDDALSFTVADKTALADKKRELAAKSKQDVTAQKKALQEECRDLEAFKATLATSATKFSPAKAAEINAVIREIKDKSTIVAQLSAKIFEFAAFKHVGSPEWKALILAAQRLHEKEAISARGVEPKHCLLCRRTLTGKERTLFGDYWQFLQGTAEAELAAARQQLGRHLVGLERASAAWPSFSPTEVAVKILQKDAPADLKKIKIGFDQLNQQLDEWIRKLRKEQDVAYRRPAVDLGAIDKAIADKRTLERKMVDPSAQMKRLAREITHLEQKQQASRLVPKIKKYIAWLRWEDTARTINLPGVRGGTTRKKADVMSEIVISRYVELFNKEAELLDCNFGLEVESYGRDATTIKGLKLEFARGHSPSDILSEGEQTVSSLADFLTEAKLDTHNSGIIFDDPVTSLDHDRRSTIAQRLVEEAKDRQVIVLTHDVVFLLDLQHYADRESVEYISVSMRKNGESVGLIKPELPWVALDVRKKAGFLKNELQALKKAELGDPDEYRNKIKLWYLLLRESWERAVEERLFKGVIQRFNRTVQTQRLPKVSVTEALIKEVNDGMTGSSGWLHDLAAGLNPTVPKNPKLEADLRVLEDFISRCKPD